MLHQRDYPLLQSRGIWGAVQGMGSLVLSGQMFVVGDSFYLILLASGVSELSLSLICGISRDCVALGYRLRVVTHQD